jgi:tetratricopeptide (TPR) repeat protein
MAAGMGTIWCTRGIERGVETGMTEVRRAIANVGIAAVCVAMLLPPGLAQKPSAPGNPATTEHTVQVLVTNAHALESRGRPDMAVQIWQQILLSDPKNTNALAGLARDFRLIGNLKESDAALEKLRGISPSDPDIPKIKALTSTRTQSDKLRQAGELARQGKNEDAIRIYRELYSDRPPDGDIAMAYYQTLYGTANGKEQAIIAIRALASRNPGDSRYSVELGIMLTYEARTREEGIRILQSHPLDSNARQALRQALIWNSANPTSAAQLRDYVKTHPQDVEMAGHLKEDEQKLAQMNSGIARTAEERAAFAALNAHNLEDAQPRFMALLQKDPNNGRIAAGMGFLRMQQNNFGGAISYLTQAEANLYKAAAVENAMATSRFWSTIGEASQAFDDNLFDVAGAKYREALTMRPRSPEALNGLAGLLTKEQQYTQAVGVYEQLLKIEPKNNDAWRGLFLAYARDGQAAKALETNNRFPPAVKTAMARDLDYLRTLATIYRAQGRSADAQRVLSQALALPFPDNGAHLKEDTRLQYAGILMESHRFDQAATMYTQILDEDGGSLPAWMGLVSAHHELKRDADSIADVEKMPPATHDASLNDSGFLSLLGAIYQRAKPDVAQELIERSVKLQIADGGQPSIPLQLQLAAIYLQRNNTEPAYAIYRQVLTMHPGSPEALTGLAGLLTKEQQYKQAGGVYEQLLKIEPNNNDAWRGLFLAYARDGQSAKALEAIDRFPPAAKTAMTQDPDYLRTLATIYRGQGRSADAQRVLSQALALPFPDNGAHLKEDTRLQYGGILMEAHRFDQAATMYTQILDEDGSNLPAWMGLVSAHHELNRNADAIGDVEKMPPANYEASLSDPGFLSMLGAIYQQANQPDIAQDLIERSVEVQIAAGGQPSIPLQLQLAAICLQRNNTAQAYAIYRQVLTAHPDRLDAWKGLIATMQATDHTNQAVQELAFIPAPVRAQLDADPEFVQSEASLYASAGDTAHATEYMNRVIRHYAQLGTPEPADLAIQNAWILHNTKNDRALYPALMRLGSRQDLTIPQRETIRTIWANWAERRAGAALDNYDNNDNNRAVEILEAAAAAFPENVEVHRVLAGGYLRTGETRLALQIYRSLPTLDASATDFQGAIGAALSANDKAQAEAWLREALDRYPQDYKILGLAARFEQARGDNQRAANFWRASIAAMPQGTPTDRLTHDLAYPDLNTKPHTARTAADLTRLLDPAYAAANEPFPKTVMLPLLPAYGPHPYMGTAPVVPGNRQNTIARQTGLPTAPLTTNLTVPQSELDLPPKPRSTAP